MVQLPELVALEDVPELKVSSEALKKRTIQMQSRLGLMILQPGAYFS